ncbi:MAG TPA: hypothetical protein VIV60_07845 [Polyangiaceae bacterium]
MSHVIPSNDLPAVIERALDQLIKREEQRRYGVRASESQTSQLATSGPRVSELATPLQLATSERQTPVRTLHLPCQKHSLKPSESRDPDPVLQVERARHRPRAAVRREVFARDGGQCTFVDRWGRRCEQRRLLEFDHCEAFAVG